MTSRRFLKISAALFLIFFAVIPAHTQEESKAQKKAEAQLKTLHGSVIDKDENPVPSSVVYLKNVKSQAVKTYIADEAGNYRFSGLDPNADYEIHAEKDGASSSTRTISSFDTKKELVLNLKIEKKKS